MLDHAAASAEAAAGVSIPAATSTVSNAADSLDVFMSRAFLERGTKYLTWRIFIQDMGARNRVRDCPGRRRPASLRCRAAGEDEEHDERADK